MESVPVAPPRRKKSESEALKRSAAEAVTKARPVRPVPPKFRSDGHLSPTVKKQLVMKPTVDNRAQAPLPHQLKPTLLQCYSVGPTNTHNHYNTTPRRRTSVKRSRSLQDDLPDQETNSATTVIDSREIIYKNVAPRPPQAAASPTSKRAGPKVKSPTERFSESTSKVHTRTKPPLPSSKEVGTFRAPQSKPSDSRKDFAKQPLSRGRGRAPARPAPPCPYIEHMSKKEFSGESREYAYVDTNKIRTPKISLMPVGLSRDIAGLDLSGCGESDGECCVLVTTPT